MPRDDESLRGPLPDEPLGLLGTWLQEARTSSGARNPDAMTLASVGADGRPSARIVLCRGFDTALGHVIFYSHRESRKGRELAGGAWAAGVFYWDALSRQARLEGPVTLSPEPESDQYFASRPRESQIAARASEQSQPIGDREALLAAVTREASRFGAGEPVPRPEFWGGFRLHLASVELWVSGPARVHDRVLWNRDLQIESSGEISRGSWRRSRLQP